MARPLRIETAGLWYHITARGSERKDIYRQDADRKHFLELFPLWVERFGCQLHAYVLMDNHYHLLAETPEPNLSRAMQWLNTSYSVWFNRHYQLGKNLANRGRTHFSQFLVREKSGERVSILQTLLVLFGGRACDLNRLLREQQLQ